jgi:hypothetical protein
VAGWFQRFGLHLAAAVGATGIFVSAVAVGAHQTQPRQPPQAQVTGTAPVRRTPTPRPTATAGLASGPVSPERYLAGTVRTVTPDVVAVQATGGREWQVSPAPGALIRLDGKTVRLDQLEPGDMVVILGQAQRPAGRFLAHAITAKTK